MLHAPQQAHLTEIPSTELSHAYTTDTLIDQSGGQWYMDYGAMAHLSNNAGILNSTPNRNVNHSVIVGNGSKIPVTCIGSTSIQSSSRPLNLQNVLIAPKIVKNLISVRKLTKDNWCSVEFDPFGFSIKDLPTRTTLL